MSPHWLHLVHTFSRWLAGLAGTTFLYMGVFTYQDEAGKRQNRLIDFWVKVSERQESALSTYVAMMRRSSGLALTSLQKLFGDRLLSLRAIVISLSLSICSGCLVTASTRPFFSPIA